MIRKAKVRQAQKGRYAKRWTFRLTGENGEQIAHSQQWYENKMDMIDTLAFYFPDFKLVNETK